MKLRLWRNSQPASDEPRFTDMYDLMRYLADRGIGEPVAWETDGLRTWPSVIAFPPIQRRDDGV